MLKRRVGGPSFERVSRLKRSSQGWKSLSPRSAFLGLLGKSAKQYPDEPSESGKGKRRTSRDQ